MPIWGNMVGTDGKVSVPSIGAVVGTICHWTLRREESGSGPLRPMTLRASFSYVNEPLLMEESLTKEITITIRKGTYFLVTGERMAFVDEQLIMEECQVEAPSE